MKIKVYTQVKPVFIQENSFKNDKGEELKYYHAVCVCGTECDKISIKSDVVPKLNNFIGSIILGFD